MREIKQDDRVLARHIPAQEAWGEGLKFFSNDSEFVQIGTWGYGDGKTLAAHAHNPAERLIGWTQEVLYVRKGRLRADIYDSDNVLIVVLTVEEGDILILLQGGHGYTILEAGTQVLEIKNGPYPGPEIDRRRLP